MSDHPTALFTCFFEPRFTKVSAMAPCGAGAAQVSAGLLTAATARVQIRDRPDVNNLVFDITVRDMSYPPAATAWLSATWRRMRTFDEVKYLPDDDPPHGRIWARTPRQGWNSVTFPQDSLSPDQCPYLTYYPTRRW